MGCGTSYESFESHQIIHTHATEDPDAYKQDLERIIRNDFQRLDSINDIFMIVRRKIAISTPPWNTIHIGHPRSQIFENMDDNSFVANTGVSLNKYYIIKQFPKNKNVDSDVNNEYLFVRETSFHVKYATVGKMYPSFIYQDNIDTQNFDLNKFRLGRLGGNDNNNNNNNNNSNDNRTFSFGSDDNGFVSPAASPRHSIIKQIPPAIPLFITALEDNDNYYLISELPKEFNPNSPLLLGMMINHGHAECFV